MCGMLSLRPTDEPVESGAARRQRALVEPDRSACTLPPGAREPGSRLAERGRSGAHTFTSDQFRRWSRHRVPVDEPD